MYAALQGTGYNLLLYMKHNIIPDYGLCSCPFGSACLNYPYERQLSLYYQCHRFVLFAASAASFAVKEEKGHH